MQRRTSILLGLVTLAIGFALSYNPVYAGAKHGASTAGIPLAVIAVAVCLVFAAGLTLLVRGLRAAR